MKKVDHLVARAFKGAMAFVLAVGLCPVAPAMAQEGATANEEGGAAAAIDGALVLLRRMLLKMTLRIPAFPLTLQKRLPWPMGKPMDPTMPTPRPMAGKLGAVASGWLTPKAA